MQNDRQIVIRAPRSEVERWQLAAQDAGESLSAWIRRMLAITEAVTGTSYKAPILPIVPLTYESDGERDAFRFRALTYAKAITAPIPMSSLVGVGSELVAPEPQLTLCADDGSGHCQVCGLYIEHENQECNV